MEGNAETRRRQRKRSQNKLIFLEFLAPTLATLCRHVHAVSLGDKTLEPQACVHAVNAHGHAFLVAGGEEYHGHVVGLRVDEVSKQQGPVQFLCGRGTACNQLV